MSDREKQHDDADTGDGEVDQPGLSQLREAVANVAERLPSTPSFRDDAVAGLNGALASVPDGMATALLVGVNPIYGLYACIAGPIAGGLLTSSALMVIATSSSSALTAGQALASVPAGERPDALWLMLLLAGAFVILLGVLGLGRLTRFVSYSVMTGFIIGIAVITILSQVPTAVGYQPEGSGSVVRAAETVAHFASIDIASLLAALAALAATIVLPRTFVGNLATLVAIVVPSAAVVLLGADSVELVRDVGEIPQGLPLPSLPNLGAISPDVVTGALALGTIVLVQGAGVSQSVPNPGGTRTDASRDFIAQGAGNLASGLLGGTPVGGSIRTTALTVISGARSRWAVIMIGVWMALIVGLFPGLVGDIAMPTLAAVLIVAAASTIRPREVISLLHTGWPSRIASVTTFLATLVLPIQAAVGIGVALSSILYLYESAGDISVVELVRRDDGRIEERDVDDRLRSDDVTVIDVYGVLFYAGARRLEQRLPDARGSRRAAVVLRLRGQPRAAATLIDVLANNADELADAGGRLYLSGIGDHVQEQIERTNRVPLGENVELFPQSKVIGASTDEAVKAARRWLAEGNGTGGDATQRREERGG